MCGDNGNALAQILAGDGAEAFYRGRVFLGCDGAPLTFQARGSCLLGVWPAYLSILSLASL
jgi:hypothetical protein